MNQRSHLLPYVVLRLGTAFTLALAIGCGGGGGGGNNSTPAAVSPAITAQPTDQTVTPGQSATFSMTVNGTPAPTSQWERSADSATWTPIAGATATSYTFTAQLADNGAQFRATATNSAGSATSNAATLNVHAAVAVWATNGTPWGIAVDSQDHVFVTYFLQNMIEKFTPTGTLLASWGSAGHGPGQFLAPKYAATDGSDNLVVADNMNARMQIFTSAGAFLSQFGTYGEGSVGGTFNGPAGVAIDATHGWIYVQDSNNNRIEKFDLAGTFLNQWGTYGTGNGQFRFVIPGDLTGGPEGGLAVDAGGNLYVVDTRNCRVQAFTSDGAYVTQWGGQGSADGQFLYPSGIAVDKAKGYVYVVDNSTPNNATGNVCKVVKFDTSGQFLSRWAPMSDAGVMASSIGIATDGAGAVYVVQGNAVGKYLP